MVDVATAAALAIAAVMLVTWVTSVVLRDASVIDVVWGVGFAVVAWVACTLGDGPAGRRVLLAVLVSIWALRLTGYLAWRNLGHGEDRRYRTMRQRWAPHFWVVSLVVVFLLQGLLQWVVSLPVLVGAGSAVGAIGGFAIAGAVLWSCGVTFETVADVQLARFKARPENRGRVLDRGLWRYSRHPNYFGDACVWWGIGLIGLEAGWRGVVALVGPLVMTVFLLRVSGVSLLERTIGDRRPGYAAYVRRTSAFLPLPPRLGTPPSGICATSAEDGRSERRNPR